MDEFLDMVGGFGGMLPQKKLDFLQPQKHYFRHSDRIFAFL